MKCSATATARFPTFFENVLVSRVKRRIPIRIVQVLALDAGCAYVVPVGIPDDRLHTAADTLRPGSFSAPHPLTERRKSSGEWRSPHPPNALRQPPDNNRTLNFGDENPSK
jgi:hypothetical protein